MAVILIFFLAWDFYAKILNYKLRGTMLYRQLHMFAPKLVHMTRCLTCDRLTFVLFFEAVISYDVVVLLRINCLERFTVCRLETT